MNNTKKVIILFILAILSIGGLLLTINHVIKDDPKEKKLELELNKEEKIVDAIDFTINPGDEITYKVVINTETSINAKVSIWFVGVNSELKNIINIYSKYENTETNKESITTYTQTNKLTFNINIDKVNNYFELIFEMPSDVGNNSQNKDYAFETHIKVEG